MRWTSIYTVHSQDPNQSERVNMEQNTFTYMYTFNGLVHRTGFIIQFAVPHLLVCITSQIIIIIFLHKDLIQYKVEKNGG